MNGAEVSTLECSTVQQLVKLVAFLSCFAGLQAVVELLAHRANVGGW